MKFKLMFILLFSEPFMNTQQLPENLILDNLPNKTTKGNSGTFQRQSIRRNELEKWMLYQNRKDSFPNLNFETLSPTMQKSILANDFRPTLNPMWFRSKMPESNFQGKNSQFPKSRRTTDQTLEEMAIKNTEIAQEQKRLLLLQLYEVVHEINNDESVGDIRIGKLLSSYLQHLEYIYEKQGLNQELSPPVLYNYHIDETIAPYCDSPNLELPDENFLDEKGDLMVDLFDKFNQEHLNLVRTTRLVQNSAQRPKVPKIRKLFFGKIKNFFKKKKKISIFKKNSRRSKKGKSQKRNLPKKGHLK